MATPWIVGENTNGADPDAGCAVVFILYIQNSRLEGVFGTFLENYIWARINGLSENAQLLGIDRDFPVAGLSGGCG